MSPKNPDELRERESLDEREWSPWLLTRIRELETERRQLVSQLSKAPRHDPVVFQKNLGFHSAFEDSEGAHSEQAHWLSFSLARRQFIRSIALAPATSPFGPADEAYAFPSRFKIEILQEPGGEFTTVVDWMAEDFPDPGAYPAFFADIDLWAEEIRMTVPKWDLDGNYVYFALGEVYFFGGKPSLPLDNVALWAGTTIEASDSFNLFPNWNTRFLRDRVNNLGFPVKDRKERQGGDLIIIPEEGEELPESIEIIVDFKSIKKGVGRMDIWPAEPPNDLALLGFGFPEEMSVEFSTNKDFLDARTVSRGALIDASRTEFRSMFSARVRPIKARYARIRMSGLKELNGRRILSLGEIALYQTDGSLAKGAKISVRGLPEKYEKELGLLQDGYSWGRQILSELEWIRGLAERAPLDARLAMVREELNLSRRALRRLQSQALYAAGVVVVVFFLGAMVLQRRKRQRMLQRLGERITRDLHDEVGSNLGSITLMADDLASEAKGREIRDDLDDLSLMAREANASLREIVWGKEQASVTLSELLEKLSERAERVLRGVELRSTFPDECPDVVIPLSVKRHLIMFFKEVVHNCARHASASAMTITASVSEKEFRLEVSDDGKGFEASEASGGWGLNNMRKRADELGGKVDISSHVGEGTSIELIIPLNMLSKEPKQSYKTSN